MLDRTPAGCSRPAGRQRGNTLLGLIIGLVVGLAIAVVVALFVTRATIPFVNKAPRAVPGVASDAESGKLPDPNKGLYSKDSTPPVVSAPANLPPPPNVAPGADGPAPVVERSQPDSKITMLQAGAFSNADDAENMRGKLALLGFDSRVTPGERDGAKLFRVRLGPYTRIDDLNRARQRLIENGVEATLVAPGKYAELVRDRGLPCRRDRGAARFESTRMHRERGTVLPPSQPSPYKEEGVKCPPHCGDG